MLHQMKSPPLSDSEIWNADSGTTHHITGNMTDVFDTRPPSVGEEDVVLGDGKILPVKAVGSLKLKFHQARTNNSPHVDAVCVLLTDVYVLEGIQFNVFSISRAQK
ncbi:unnamed protein product, partial [Sphacelaria rigidula]